MLMKRLFLILPVLMFLLVSCSNDDDAAQNNAQGVVRYMLPETRDITLTANQRSIMKANTKFAFDLMRNINVINEVNGNKDRSVFVSPFGVATMLGMIYNGAADDVRTQIAQTLHLDNYAVDDVNGYFKKLLTEIPEADASVKVGMANALLVNKQYTIDPQFAAVAADSYGAKVASMDFDSPSTTQEVNHWASDKTHGLINNVVESVDADVAAYLFNSMCFVANWTKQFDREKTTTETFTSENGATTNVSMMHNRACILACANDYCSAIKLPYGGKAWNMMMILPNKGVTIKDVLDNITPDFLHHTQFYEMVLDLSLPKFEFTDKEDLQKVMKNMGLGMLFDEGRLTRLCADDKLHVSDMWQQSKISVSEEGTKATAVTMSEMFFDADGGGMLDALKDGFNANRSFLYIVYESTSFVPVFIGTFNGK